MMMMLMMKNNNISLVSSWAVVLASAMIFGVNAQTNGKWQDSYNLEFSYDPNANNGPDAWSDVEGLGVLDNAYGNTIVGRLGNQCGGGTRPRPSPLHLQSVSEPCTDIHELLPRQMSSNDCGRADMIFDITPHVLRASFPVTEDTCVRPTLVVSGRFDDYSLLWMELHARSEHVVEGKRYDAELQMIHQGVGSDDGQLLGVSLLLEATASVDDLEFEFLLQQWEEVAQQEAEACEDGGRIRRRRRRQLMQASDYQVGSKTAGKESQQKQQQQQQQPRELQFQPSPCATDRFGAGCEPLAPRDRMFPYNIWQSIWYYGYFGSLTSPPCTNLVQWRILEEPMRVSRRQYQRVTQLLQQSRDENCQGDTAVDPRTGENTRPLQIAGEFFQAVYRCTFQDFGHFVYSPEEQ